MTHYLDHNAGSPVEPRVLQRFLEVEQGCPGNPGSLHAAGRKSRAVLEEARSKVAEVFGVSDSNVYFVSGGTEANNLAVLGSGDPNNPVLLSEVEHPSTLDACEPRGRVLWQVDSFGRARIEDPGCPVGLLCLVHGQNEVGSLQPIEEAADLANKLSVPLHVDASQTLGRVSLGAVLQRAGTVALSAHKVGGLRGMGVLIAKGGGQLRPLMRGGGQESGLRPGTTSPALAAATALAVELAVLEQVGRARAMQEARQAFESGLSCVDVQRLTPEDSLPNTLMLMFPGVDGRNLLPALDLEGVEASQGSACSSGSPHPPVVLRAMGLGEEQARACVRFSFSHHDRPESTARSGADVAKVVRRLQLRLHGK